MTAEQLAHLQIATVSQAQWTTSVSTTGTVDWDSDHTTQAITQVSGPITRLLVDEGARHSRPAAALRREPGHQQRDLGVPQGEEPAGSRAAQPRSQQGPARAQGDRARELESAEADYNDAATDVQTALQALNIFGVNPQDLKDAEGQNQPIRPELPMRAPIAGTVVQKLVLPGQVIQAGTTVAFVISDVSTLWVQGHIYDKDLQSVHVGDEVEIHSSSFPDTFHGTVSYIGDLIDPATRTTPVRIVTQNTGGLLKKDLFVDVVIHDKTTRDVLVVPTAAVLYDEQNFPFVYVQVEPGKFAQRLVKIGGQQDDEIEILDGVKEGDRVVSQGSVFLQFANTYRG